MLHSSPVGLLVAGGDGCECCVVVAVERCCDSIHLIELQSSIWFLLKQVCPLSLSVCPPINRSVLTSARASRLCLASGYVHFFSLSLSACFHSCHFCVVFFLRDSDADGSVWRKRHTFSKVTFQAMFDLRRAATVFENVSSHVFCIHVFLRIHCRESLPAPMFSRNSVSIWSILKKCIGLVRTYLSFLPHPPTPIPSLR